MITRKIKSKASDKDKWSCLQDWMRENRIPRPKLVKTTITTREEDRS